MFVVLHSPFCKAEGLCQHATFIGGGTPNEPIRVKQTNVKLPCDWLTPSTVCVHCTTHVCVYSQVVQQTRLSNVCVLVTLKRHTVKYRSDNIMTMQLCNWSKQSMCPRITKCMYTNTIGLWPLRCPQRNFEFFRKDHNVHTSKVRHLGTRL